jgi:hypothetical protein
MLPDDAKIQSPLADNVISRPRKEGGELLFTRQHRLVILAGGEELPGGDALALECLLCLAVALGEVAHDERVAGVLEVSGFVVVEARLLLGSL